ncbi:MAG: WXG100 family type VII secretion target [Oscillospiraceae bacterium]|nr:WXG100 family type VII secretion target [Oscillospiraceae bacterium]
MAIKINTAAVRRAAGIIDGKNKAFDMNLDTLESSIRKMNAQWDGAASNAAVQAFYDIKTKYKDTRRTVISDFTGFLKKQIGDNYEMTETKISKAASAFK